MNYKLLVPAFILLCGCSAASQASLIEVDYLAAGDRLLTRDTATNLEWLDLTETTGISYNSMQGLLSPGGTYAGFRYATVFEIDTLQVSAGLPAGLNFLAIPVLVNRTIDLINKVGITIPPNTDGSYSALGMTGDPFDPTTFIDDRIVRGLHISYVDVGMRTSQGVLREESESRQTGSWLVRNVPPPSPVPVPGALFLFLGGLAAISRLLPRRRA